MSKKKLTVKNRKASQFRGVSLNLSVSHMNSCTPHNGIVCLKGKSFYKGSDVGKRVRGSAAAQTVSFVAKTAEALALLTGRHERATRSRLSS